MGETMCKKTKWLRGFGILEGTDIPEQIREEREWAREEWREHFKSQNDTFEEPTEVDGQ